MKGATSALKFPSFHRSAAREAESSRRTPEIGLRTVVSCCLFAALTAIYPFVRAAFRVEVDYNEGWNIYNADRLAHHQLLYPVAYGWQAVNYPMLSFAIMAWLHRVTHDYLFTARAVSLLSLLGCCFLVYVIVRHLSRSRRAAILAGFLCLGIFCTNADRYVGMDDPQMLAQFVFLLAFVLYLRRRQSLLAITWAAVLFVIAGSIKHNPLDLPLAVLIDLAILSWRRALWFSLCGVSLACVSVMLNIRFGGPFFLAQMLAPRTYTLAKAARSTMDGLGPLMIPVLIALVASFVLLRNPRRRIVGILFFSALFIGSAFAGGQGVAVNTFFSAMIATAIVLGLLLARREQASWLPDPLKNYIAPGLFFWLIIPAVVAGVADPVASIHDTVAAERRFDQQVALLRAQPAPVLCESLLRCYLAGKPYVYDPFNATRLITLHKVDPAPMLNALQSGGYSAVQMDREDDGDAVRAERFPAGALSLIKERYQPAFADQDLLLYVPQH